MKTIKIAAECLVPNSVANSIKHGSSITIEYLNNKYWIRIGEHCVPQAKSTIEVEKYGHHKPV